MSDSIVRTPWKDYMGEVPMHLEYFDGSMFEAVENVAKKYPNSIAFTFMGKSTTYRQMIREIEQDPSAVGREGNRVLPERLGKRGGGDARPVLQQV